MNTSTIYVNGSNPSELCFIVEFDLGFDHEHLYLLHLFQHLSHCQLITTAHYNSIDHLARLLNHTYIA